MKRIGVLFVVLGTSLGAGVLQAEEFFIENFLMTYGSATVDGVIEAGEWDAAGWKALDQPYYVNGLGPTDLSDARYAVYWNGDDDMFYCVVTGRDTTHVFVDTYESWKGMDCAEVYTDATNSNDPDFGADNQYTCQQWVAAPMVDPTQANLWSRSGQVIPESICPDMAHSVDGNVLTYEFAIPAFSYYDDETPENTTIADLVGGSTVGFDVIMNSRVNDADFGMKSNNLVGGKSSHGGKIQNWTLFTIAGDLNGDGTVSSSDLDIVRANWGSSCDRNDFTVGDANGDGATSSGDLDIIRANWGSDFAPPASAVPEPTSLLLVACIGLLFSLRRRR